MFAVFKLHERLRERLEELPGCKVPDIARKMKMDPRRVAHYFEGKRRPDYPTFIALCAALETTPNAILGVGSDLEPFYALLARLGQAGREQALAMLRVIEAHQLPKQSASPIRQRA